MDKNSFFKRKKKIKKVYLLLKFYQKLIDTREIPNDVFALHYLLDDLSQLIPKYDNLVQTSVIQSRIKEMSNLKDDSKSGIEKACKDLKKDLKKALEDFLGEDLEIILNEPIKEKPRQSLFILGGSGVTVVIVGIIFWLTLAHFNFALTTEENLISVFQGTNLTIPVNVELETGDPRSVNVHCSTSSPEMICEPSDKSVYLDGSKVIMFEIDTTSNTPTGPHSVSIKAEKDYIAREQLLMISVEEEPIIENEPIIVEDELKSKLEISTITPKNNGRIISMPLVLTVQVNTDLPIEGANVEFVLDGNVIETTTTDSEGYASSKILALDNGIHFWSAKATKENYEYAKLNINQFTSSFVAGAPPPPELLEPKTGGIINDNTLYFRWTNVSDESGIGRYTIELTSIDGRLVFRENLSSNQFSINKTLEDGTYAWKVRAIDGTGNAGLFSEISFFNFVNPEKPT